MLINPPQSVCGKDL